MLGEQLGRTDVRVLRRRVGYLSAALAGQLRPDAALRRRGDDRAYAALEPWWHRYTTADEEQALACLERMGVGWTAERSSARCRRASSNASCSPAR